MPENFGTRHTSSAAGICGCGTIVQATPLDPAVCDVAIGRFMCCSGWRRPCAAMERECLGHANLAHPAHADGCGRCSPNAHGDGAPIGDDVRRCSADDWEVVMRVRAFLMVIAALLLSACVDSQRFHENFGPHDYDRTERVPSK